MTTPPESSGRSSRAQLWILITVFFAPLLVAFILYYGLEGWRPSGQTNHGDLIDPPRTLPAVQLNSRSDAALAPEFLRGKWSLVYIGAGTCDERCRTALTLMRQTRLALNDDLPRVQRVFLATEPCCDQAWLESEQAGLIVIEPQAAARALIEQFPNANEGRIYIVDPLANLMMSYGPDAPPKGLLEDLKKLLKLSHIG